MVCRPGAGLELRKQLLCAVFDCRLAAARWRQEGGVCARLILVVRGAAGLWTADRHEPRVYEEPEGCLSWAYLGSIVVVQGSGLQPALRGGLCVGALLK